MKNYLNLLGKKSRKAFLRKIATKKKNKVLLDFAGEVKKRKKLILIKNVKDIKYEQTLLQPTSFSNFVQRFYHDL